MLLLVNSRGKIIVMASERGRGRGRGGEEEAISLPLSNGLVRMF